MNSGISRSTLESADRSDSSRLDALLMHCIECGASDLHLSQGEPPMLRLNGELSAVSQHPPLSEPDISRIAAALLGDRPLDWHTGSIDGACCGPDGTRFRFNLYRSRQQLAVAIRRLENRFRSLSELGLPESLYTLTRLKDGLVIVSGPTGAGKSTTLATLIDRINQERRGHIVTIEDPVEYLHRPVRSLVHQRQVGIDAPTFNDALVAALRQDPDVILVGEIRDLATIRTALIAAQTGHLVFTTLHAGDCAQAVERLVAVFGEGEQEAVRRQLALVLRAVVVQHLLPTESAPGRAGRVAASEILIVNAAVANLIASGRSAQIYSTMESGQSFGMQTLEQDLARLWVTECISESTAVACARNPAVLRDRAALLRREGRKNFSGARL